MNGRRSFFRLIASLFAMPQDGYIVPTDSATEQPVKKYHVTLYSGGVVIAEYDTAEVTGGSFGQLYCKDSNGKQIQIVGTLKVEEL